MAYILGILDVLRDQGRVSLQIKCDLQEMDEIRPLQKRVFDFNEIYFVDIAKIKIAVRKHGVFYKIIVLALNNSGMVVIFNNIRKTDGGF